MKKLLLFLLPILFLSSQCNPKCACSPIEENSGVLALNFKPIFNSKPFVINQIYDIGGKKVRFTRLSILLSNVIPKTASQLIGSISFGGHLIDITALDDSTKSAKGATVNVENMNLGEMSFLDLNLGVSKDYNSLKPTTFPSTNVLSDAGYYWDDWKSYIFVKLEGAIDKDGDGRLETGITLHTGGDESLRTLSVPKDFKIATLNSAPVNFDLNINTLLRGLDLATVNSTHQTGDKPTMLKIMDNLKDAVIVK